MRRAIAIATANGFGLNIAVDANHVYWGNQRLPGEPGAVMRAPITGGVATAISTADTGGNPGAIVATAGRVYWIDSDLFGGSFIGVGSVPTSGGAPQRFSVPAGEDPIQTAVGLAVDAENVYWSSTYAGMVLRVPVTGGVSTEIASAFSPNAVAVDATNVYWSAPISKLPLAGGTSTVLSSDSATSLVVNDGYLYWVTTSGLKKVSVDGGSVVTLSSVGIGDQLPHQAACTNALAVDETSVYWVGQAAGRYGLYKIPK